MKRFIAYILLCVSVLISVFTGFVPVVLSINASADYDSGQNFVYKISLKDDGTKNEGDITDGDAIKAISDVFKTRLDEANISTYELENEGNDTIRLSFKDKSEINTYVSTFLNFDGGVQAMDYSGKILLDSADFISSGKAYVDYTDNSPVIVLPLAKPEDFKTKLYENINGTKKDDTQANSVHSLSNSEVKPFADTETEETKNENYLYIVNNWDSETYSMSTIIEDNTSANTKETEAYIDRIDATKAENLFYDYDSANPNKTFTQLKYTGFITDANNDATLANRLANIVCSKFNASALDYKVTLINKDYINTASNNVSAFIENLIYHGNTYGSYQSIVMSSLLISTLVAFVVVGLFLVLNYGLGSLASISMTPAMLLVTLAIFNSFGAEFNIGTVIALIALAVVSIFSACSYYKAVKEELYKGKNLRKANQEASKRTISIQADLSIITILLGLVAYLIPNSIMLSIGAVLILGGLLNLVINGLCLRGLYYFLSNSTFIADHLNLLMVERKKIPDLSKDEKPTYFDSFKKSTSKNKTKYFGISAVVLLIASIIGMTSFQLINGNIYNTSSNTVTSSRIYIQFNYNENSRIQSVSDLETKVLNNLYTFDTSKDARTTTNVKYNDVLTYTYSYKENYANNKETLKKVYYIVELKNILDENTKVSAYVDDSHMLDNVSVDDALQYLIVDYNNVSNFEDVALKGVTNVNDDTINYYCLLFAAIGCAIIGVYMILRFGISRGLVSLIFVGTIVTITTGIFSLIRGTFSSQITLGVVLLVILGFAILDNYFVYEKSIKKEKHLDKSNIAGLKEDSNYAISLSHSNVIIMSILSSFILISFLFAKTFTTYFVVFVILGLLLMILFYKALTVNITYLFSSFFGSIGSRISENYTSHRNKRLAKKNKTDKGDGPEEATFIGIND